METVTDFILGGSKITVDGDCSLEGKRHLLLGRKAMANLDSILKSRDNTLLTKVCIFKATVFPVFMYGCDIWTIKNTERWRIGTLVLLCWRRLFGVPWTARKLNQSIKKMSPEYSFEELMLKLKLQHFGHLMWRTVSLEKTLILRKIEGRYWRGQQKMRWLNFITNSMDMNLIKLWELVKRETWHAVLHGITKSQQDWATELTDCSINNSWVFLSTLFYTFSSASDFWMCFWETSYIIKYI